MDLSVSSSTISDNETIEDGGGGLSSWGYGSVSIDNSTISGKSTVWRGGGIETDNDLTISNSTITGNTADGEGGGIVLYGER